MDNNKYAVVAENISKCYKMYSGQKEKFLDLILPKGAGKTFYALKDISFKVERGEIVGLLGLNGAGKSTLSNILGGVSLPNDGKITINGESSLIAIGLGLNNFLTGLENIEVKALMMGYKKDEIEKIKQEVIEFAEIGDFINQPIRTYSSGMRSRLGFGISIHMNPDILVIDEALSVGDPTFAQKCLDKMNEFKESGKTIFFVSHSLPQVKQFCNKAMWLEYGTLREYGDVEEVLPKYQNYIDVINKMTKEEKLEYKKSVLKNQEHSLVAEFKIVDPRLKKVIPSGKVIKYAKVVNKELNIKSVPYNFDFYTFVLGAIPSAFRGKMDTAILIFIAQVLNFLIIPLPVAIITNFIIGLISGIITGKNYINYLIEEKGYIPYHIWRSSLENEEVNTNVLTKVNKGLRKVNRKNIMSLITVVIVGILSVSTAIFVQYRPIIESKLAAFSKEMVIKDFAIINMRNDNGYYVNEIVTINTDSINGELRGVIYPGTLQVNTENGSDEIRSLIKNNSIDEIKEVFSSNYNININNYIFIEGDENNEKEYYEERIWKILNADDESIDSAIDELLINDASIKNEDIKKFSDEFNKNSMKIRFDYVKHQKVPLLDFVDKSMLELIDRQDLYEYNFLVEDKRILQNSRLVSEIKDEYERAEEKKRLEEAERKLEEERRREEERKKREEQEKNNSTNSQRPNNNNNNNTNRPTNPNPTPTPPPTTNPPVVEPTPPPVEPTPPPVDPPVTPDTGGSNENDTENTGENKL